jgi:hypothetical protein
MQKDVIVENSEINIDVTELNGGVYIYKLNPQGKHSGRDKSQ